MLLSSWQVKTLILFRVSLAAGWDINAIKEVSQVLVAEAKSKEVDVLLGPTGKRHSEVLSSLLTGPSVYTKNATGWSQF